MWVFFILEPARLLGACKPGLRACKDSTTGVSSVVERVIIWTWCHTVDLCGNWNKICIDKSSNIYPEHRQENKTEKLSKTFSIFTEKMISNKKFDTCPASNCFIEVNRTGDRKSSEILFANTHQTVDNTIGHQNDKLCFLTSKKHQWSLMSFLYFHYPTSKIATSLRVLRGSWFCKARSQGLFKSNMGHNKKNLSGYSRNIAYRRGHSIVFSKFEILNSAFANFYLFSVLDFSGLIMSVWAFAWQKWKFNLFWACSFEWEVLKIPIKTFDPFMWH